MSTTAASANTVVIAYLTGHFDHFIQNLEKARTDFDGEAIHQFRVSVKRIRSIFRAINKIFPGNALPDELLQPLREIFKAGGPVRDDQVQLDLVEYLEKNHPAEFPLIKDHYHRRIQHSIEEFRTRSMYLERDKFESFPEGIRQAMAQLEENELHSRLYAWMDQSLEKLKQRRLRATDPFKLHRFRTRFKEMSYMAELIYGSKMEPNIDKETYQKLKNFAQHLGDWHDYFQLWSKAGDLFRSATDVHLMEEAFRLKILLTPLHEKFFNDIQDLLKEDGLFTVNFTFSK